jgi:hypothetical protein
VGDLLGHCERSGTLHLNEPPDAERESADYWHCAVDRVGPDGLAIGDPLFDNAETGGFVIGGHLARAICEAVMRQARRADEAEGRIEAMEDAAGCPPSMPLLKWLRTLVDTRAVANEQRCELDRLQRQQGELHKDLAALQPVIEQLPRTDDGHPYVRGYDTRTFWAVWRYDAEHAVRVSEARQAEPDWDVDWQWQIDDAEDECEILSIWLDGDAARAAAGGTDG